MDRKQKARAGAGTAVLDAPRLEDLTVAAREPDGAAVLAGALDRAKEAMAIVPKGYKLLPAGVTRKLRVNKTFIYYGGDHPAWLLDDGEETTEYRDVKFLGQVEAVCETGTFACGNEGSAYMKTTGPLLVKE
jgi:hypothetical protein